MRTVLALLSSLSLHCGNDDAAEAGSDAGGAKTHAGASGDTGGGTSADRDADASSLPEVGPPVEAGSPGRWTSPSRSTPTQGAHAISPYVYGVNDGTQAAAAHATIVRTGGNRLTAYNWENNASNAGSDYQFENDDYLCSNNHCVPTNDTAGRLPPGLRRPANAAGAATLITVPIVDYVSADKSPAGDVRNSGANYLMTRFKQNARPRARRSCTRPTRPTGFVYQDEMVALAHSAPSRGASSAGSSTTSRTSGRPPTPRCTPRRSPTPSSRSATSTSPPPSRTSDPTAHVIGPVNYGWEGYVNLQSATDSQADGDFITGGSTR